MTLQRNCQRILTCFRDETDAAHCRVLLGDIPEVTDLVLDRTETERLEADKCQQGDVRLIVVSSRLYPGEDPELVGKLRAIYPDAEILLITPADYPLPRFQQLARDHVMHLAVAREGRSVAAPIRKLLAGSGWSLDDYVLDGTIIHAHSLCRSTEKERLIEALDAVIDGEGEEYDVLRQKAALLADEMLENALYGAPRTMDGNKLFHKGESRKVAEEEQILFRFAFDGQSLAMEIADGWGTLSPEQVVSSLANNHDTTVNDDETGGRGLFIIWRFLDHFHVTIQPGMQTVLGGHLQVSSPLDPEAIKGFSISSY